MLVISLYNSLMVNPSNMIIYLKLNHINGSLKSLAISQFTTHFFSLSSLINIDFRNPCKTRDEVFHS